MDLSRSRSIVFTLATGGLLALVVILLAMRPIRAAGPWYVVPGGDDGNDCLSPGAPCASMNAVLGEAELGDTDHVAAGTYVGEEDSRLPLEAEVILSDGWSVSPTSIHVTHDLGDTTTRILTISNQGSAELEFEVSERNTLPVLEGLVAYYPFNGSANDDTGNGFDGTVLGATLIPDRYGEPESAYSFDGLDDYIAIDNTSTFNFLSGGFTLAAWASHSEYNSDNMIIGKHNCGGFNGYYMGVNNGRFQFYVSSDPRLLTAETYQDGEWHFVVGVYDDANQYLYVDSALKASQPKVHANPNDLDISIGRARDGCGYFRGEIDDVHIYDRALTEAEIQELYAWQFAADVPWLSTDPVAGTVPAYSSVPVEVTFDATATRPGTYNAEVVILSSDPVTPTVSIQVTMTVEAEHQVFLPCIARNYCPDFFDDFSNPASGWEVVDDSYVRTEYLDGEYRILTKKSGYYYLFRAPTCDRQNYTVEVDARWVGTPGASYGLVFGLAGDYSRFYLFDVNTDYREFDLVRRDPGGFTHIVWPTYSAAINGGTASNHLKVTRSGSEITLEVNGAVLGTWYDGTISGPTGAGLVTNPYSTIPTSDARFDNFAMVSLTGGDASVQGPTGAMDEVNGLAAPDTWREPVPADTDW